MLTIALGLPRRTSNRHRGAKLSHLTWLGALAVFSVDVFAFAVAANVLPGGLAFAQEAPAESGGLSADAINGASLEELPAEPATSESPAPGVIRLQVLLDRAGSSPGVIDGFDGENVRKAVRGFEAMQGLDVDGVLDAEVVGRLESPDPVVGSYTITEEDTQEVTGATPEDYSELAQLEFVGYASVAEALAERFHMDIDLLQALNPGAQFVPGEEVTVVAPGGDREGDVARIEADKAERVVRAYGADGNLLAVYPATIGSNDNPSPSGTHEVLAVANMPNYTYNPENFQQGDNNEILTIPPGPNGPVGTVWIDLSEPTYGIHGSPEPSLIDKTNSHGCVRLTNWDAEELAQMVSQGVTVEFVG